MKTWPIGPTDPWPSDPFPTLVCDITLTAHSTVANSTAGVTFTRHTSIGTGLRSPVRSRPRITAASTATQTHCGCVPLLSGDCGLESEAYCTKNCFHWSQFIICDGWKTSDCWQRWVMVSARANIRCTAVQFRCRQSWTFGISIACWSLKSFCYKNINWVASRNKMQAGIDASFKEQSVMPASTATDTCTTLASWISVTKIVSPPLGGTLLLARCSSDRHRRVEHKNKKGTELYEPLRPRRTWWRVRQNKLKHQSWKIIFHGWCKKSKHPNRALEREAKQYKWNIRFIECITNKSLSLFYELRMRRRMHVFSRDRLIAALFCSINCQQRGLTSGGGTDFWWNIYL